MTDVAQSSYIFLSFWLKYTILVLLKRMLLYFKWNIICCKCGGEYCCNIKEALEVKVTFISDPRD